MAKKKKRKIKKNSLIYSLIVLFLISLLIYYISNIKISNIVVKGNNIFSDWEIIQLAELDNSPKGMQVLSSKVVHKLEKSPYIKKAKVYKKSFTELVIVISENKPLFYYVPTKKTVLSDKKEVEENFSVPTLINYVPNKIYDQLLIRMDQINYMIVKRMSEIKYDPNEVDDERFLITMNDGNYVYLTINKFSKIDHYLEIVKEFSNKKGILYLDSGEYFKVINKG